MILYRLFFFCELAFPLCPETLLNFVQLVSSMYKIKCFRHLRYGNFLTWPFNSYHLQISAPLTFFIQKLLFILSPYFDFLLLCHHKPSISSVDAWHTNNIFFLASSAGPFQRHISRLQIYFIKAA